MLQTVLIRERTFSGERLTSFSPWSAIFAGAIVAISMQVMLTVLGAALGMTALPNTSADRVRDDAAVGAGIWWLVTGLVSLAAGGAMTGYLHPAASGCVRAINGFLAWCVVNVLGALMIIVGGGAFLGSSLATIVPANAMPSWAATAPADIAARSDPVTIAASTLWMTFLALILGSAVSWIASWWIGGMFVRERAGSYQSMPRGVPPMPGAPVG